MVVYLCNIACLTGMKFLLSNYPKDKNKIFCFFASLNWSLISGLRGLSVGDDTEEYKAMFTDVKFQTWNDLFEMFKQKYFHHGDGKDIGYGILEKAFQIISTNYQVWLLVIAILFFVAFGIFVYKYSENPYLSYILFSTLFYSFFAITGLRQTIATAVVVLIGIELIKKRKFVPFLILIILMSTVHASVLCFLPFYWLSRIKINKTTLVVYWLAIVSSFVFRNQLFNFLKNIAGYEQYSVYKGAGATTFTLLLLLIAVYTTYTHKLMLYRDDKGINEISINALMLSCFFSSMLMINPNTMRVVQYYSIFIVLIFPLIIKTIKTDKMQRFAAGIIVFILCILAFKKTPEYQFFWQG